MKTTTRPLREALFHELGRLQAGARQAVSAAGQLRGLALDPAVEGQDLVPESSVVRELAALLEHAVQNLARRVPAAPRSRPTRGRRRKPSASVSVP